MTHIFAVDPGKTTGYVIITDTPGNEILAWGHLSPEGVADFLEHYPMNVEMLNAIVYEDFKLFRGKAMAQTGSRFEASQVIGMLLSFSRRHDIKLIRQSTDNRDRGYAWAQVPKTSNHSKSHRLDALAHACYYLIQKKEMKPYLERVKEGDVGIQLPKQ